MEKLACWTDRRNLDWRNVRDTLAKVHGTLTLAQIAAMLPILPEWDRPARGACCQKHEKL